jgi:hypothetical protein
MSKLIQNLISFASGCIAIVACISCTQANAQVTDGSAINWQSGKVLIKNRLLPVSVSWADSPLHKQLTQFAKERQRAIFIDRRVDPTIKQTFQFLEKTTEQIVWTTADENDLGVAQIGNLLYIGPKESAATLPMVIQNAKKSLSKIDKATRKTWIAKKEIRWPKATTSIQISEWFEQSYGIKFVDKVPLDVWPEADWPKLSTTEQLSLFLVGFDLTFAVNPDGSTVDLKPFPKVDSGTLKFSLPREVKLDLKTAAREFNALKIKRAGKTLAVSGPVTSIADFQAWLVSQQIVNSDRTERTFTLNSTARRGDILATVAQQTGRKLVLDGDLSLALTDRITLKLKNAGLEQLLSECLEGSGLSYELREKTLRIFIRNK